MEIQDFAAALRAMADNVDWLAERHDVTSMAQLRREAAEHEVTTRRDADLIDELRKQVAVMGGSLDAIGRMRKSVQMGDADVGTTIQVLTEALTVIDGPCANYIPDSWTCRTEGVGRTRGAKHTAEAWCMQCVARDALERVGAVLPEVNP